MLHATPCLAVPDNELDDVIDELVARTQTKKLKTSMLRAEFLRACCSHYISVVLPELRRFEQHLKNQDILIAINPIQPLDKNVLQAGLVMEYPVDITNLLDIRYDFIHQELTFNLIFSGHRNRDPDYRFPFDSFDKVTSLPLYDIVESFVTSVLELEVER
jgi:hypothetical protein